MADNALYVFARDINHEATPGKITTSISPQIFVTSAVFPLLTEAGKATISDESKRPEFFRQLINCSELEEFLSRLCGEKLAFWLEDWNIPQRIGRNARPFPAWQTDVRPITLVVNVSKFPENQEPEGGATYVKYDDEVKELKYREFGDAIVTRGSIFSHCGKAGTNFTKEIHAFGLGPRDFLTKYPMWFFIGKLDQTWPRQELYLAIKDRLNVEIRTFHMLEIDEIDHRGRRIRQKGSCHVKVYNIADRNRLVKDEENGQHLNFTVTHSNITTSNHVHIQAIDPNRVTSQSLN